MARDRDGHELAQRRRDARAGGGVGAAVVRRRGPLPRADAALARTTRADDAPEWQAAAQFGDDVLYVTAEELQELGRRLDELVEPLVARQLRPELRPEGAREVTLIRLAFPTGG